MRRLLRCLRFEQVESRRLMVGDVAWIRHEVESLGGATLIDVDSDGDPDRVLPVFESLEMYLVMQENLGSGQFGDSIVVSRRVDAPVSDPSVRVTDLVHDLDSDGDDDLLVGVRAGFSTANYYIFYNDGNSNTVDRFRFNSVIGGGESSIQDVSSGNLDGDGNDFVVTGGNLIAENELRVHLFDRARSFVSVQRIAVSEKMIYGRFFDFDGDQDRDLIWTSFPFPFGNQVELMWSENIDGKGTLGEGRAIATHSDIVVPQTSLAVEDFTADGFADVVWTVDRTLYVYEGSAGGLKLVPKVSEGSCLSGSAVDVDADQDLDLFCGSNWFENIDGLGTLVGGDTHVVPLPPESFETIDFDGDDDLDVYGDGWWLENRRIGDSNRDGRFDSADLIAAAFDKYEQRTAATFDEGDWNGDGIFDSQDFIFALQRGNYVEL